MPGSTYPLVCNLEPPLEHSQTGASTGYMEPLRGRWPEMLEEAKHVSGDVVELSALSGAELVPLLRFIDSNANMMRHFRHVSVHAPAKGWSRSIGALVDTLLQLPALVAGIVVHPDTIEDPEPYRALGEKLWLENMDTRKRDARTVAELERYFDALPKAAFCFDIAHAGLHDHSMDLAHELIDAFGDRLREVHLSSIEPNGKHVPLRCEDETRFAPVLERCRDVPWVLEAPRRG